MHETGTFQPGPAFRAWYLPDDDHPLGYLPLNAASLLLAEGQMVLQGEPCRLVLPVRRDLTEALDAVRLCLHRHGLITAVRGEAMAVCREPHLPQIAEIDRSALRLLGLWAVKVHVNGVVRAPAGGRLVWLSHRAEHATAEPGHWDTLVAGGQPAGSSIRDTAIREGWEEAGLDPQLLAGLTPMGDLPVLYASPHGLHRELLAIFELVLPASFHPVCQDGEVQGFRLLDGAALDNALRGGLPLKFSSRLAIEQMLATPRG